MLYATSACCVMRASSAVKRPYWNSVVMSGSASTASAAAAGSASSSVRRRPQSSSFEYSALFASAWYLDRLGSRMVPSADAEQPRGKLHQPVGVVQPRHAARDEE